MSLCARVCLWVMRAQGASVVCVCVCARARGLVLSHTTAFHTSLGASVASCIICLNTLSEAEERIEELPSNKTRRTDSLCSACHYKEKERERDVKAQGKGNQKQTKLPKIYNSANTGNPLSRCGWVWWRAVCCMRARLRHEVVIVTICVRVRESERTTGRERESLWIFNEF